MSRPVLLALLLVLPLVLAGCTGGDGDGDGDGDGLTNAEEQQGWQVEVIFLDGRRSFNVSSDPDDPDSDGDGLPDHREFQLGTDPRKKDTDGDGLTDCQEAKHSVKEECEDPDFTGPFDGGTRTDARKADSDPGPSRFKLGQPFRDEVQPGSPNARYWGDGLSDGNEWNGVHVTLRNGTTILARTDPRNVDSDGDGLEDAEEILLFFTEPHLPDTDGDGCLDGVDPRPDVLEFYDLGLRNFTLHRAMEEGEAAVMLELFLETTPVRVPEEGDFSAGPNQTVDLSESSPLPFRLGSCPPHVMPDPWLRLHVLATDVADAPRSLDIGSRSGVRDERGVATLFWNPWLGQLAAREGGEPFGPEVTLTGDDATIVLSPVVRDGSGQVV